MATLTKKEIQENLHEAIFSKSRVSQAVSKDFVDIFFDTLTSVLGEHEPILISGFGKFDIQKKKERIGRNPHTEKKMILSARTVVKFKPAKILRNLVND